MPRDVVAEFGHGCCCFGQCVLQASGHRDVVDGAARRAHEVVVVPGQVLGEFHAPVHVVARNLDEHCCVNEQGDGSINRGLGD